MLAHIPAGYLSDRIGRKPLMIAAWTSGLTAAWVMALARTLPVFVVGWLLYGLTAFVSSPLNSYITGASGKYAVGRVMTLMSASFSLGARVAGEFGGKVECASYLIGPYRNDQVTVTIPGMGDRIFSMTQDDELVVSFPARLLDGILTGLKEAAKKIGARYPITVYQNFSPEFPGPYQERAKKWGII